MTTKDPLDPENVTTTRYEISLDELEARMQRQQEIHVEPAQKAVALLEAALEKVLTKLGVDFNCEPEVIKAQQDFLGIIITENPYEDMPWLDGFFIYTGYDNPVPYAWIGDARINSQGECFVDIHWFQKEKLDKLVGVRVVR